METERSQIALPAGTVEYLDEGNGPAVVLLHGLFMDDTLWDDVMTHLPRGFRYIRPILPLGAHRIPMKPDADLSMKGMAGLVADFLAALDLVDVTLVHTDWGGALFLTAMGRDDRVGSLIVLPCEAFDNFPPGIPGRLATMAARVPGGIMLAVRQLRIRRLRNLPFVFGWMTVRPISDSLARRWTQSAFESSDIRRDVAEYASTRVDSTETIADTQALAEFSGPSMVLWSAHNRIMPAQHGRRLAALLPDCRYVELADTAVLVTLDRPDAVAHEIGIFLREVAEMR
ncbi:alpha/beta fold hydrolase [Rhodococcus sp. 077-4]|uniref:alpha/beta fold hydrolase n=1 Tax=Rhodococcus sp. 077-4 TaxID=2789271 RepID=UPI0039F530A5